MSIGRTTIPYSGYGSQGLQVFTPNRIETIGAAGSLTVAQTATTPKVVAIRVDTITDYQINGTGDVATMPPGCTGIAGNVTSLKFPNGAVIEVM